MSKKSDSTEKLQKTVQKWYKMLKKLYEKLEKRDKLIFQSKLLKNA